MTNTTPTSLCMPPAARHSYHWAIPLHLWNVMADKNMQLSVVNQLMFVCSNRKKSISFNVKAVEALNNFILASAHVLAWICLCMSTKAKIISCDSPFNGFGLEKEEWWLAVELLFGTGGCPELTRSRCPGRGVGPPSPPWPTTTWTAMALIQVQQLPAPKVGTRWFSVSPISDSPIDCGLDPKYDSPIVSRSCQSDIR